MKKCYTTIYLICINIKYTEFKNMKHQGEQKKEQKNKKKQQ